MRRLLFIFCLLLCFARPALADQAVWLTKVQADDALRALQGQKEIREYCEPCGDTAFTVKEVKAPALTKKDDPYWAVSLDDDEIDLAYTYVNVKGAWVNLAKLVGVRVEGVSTLLPVTPLPRLTDDLHADFLRSSPEYKAADERLNKAWKAVLPLAEGRQKEVLLRGQKYWADTLRDLGVQKMQVYHKYHLPVPAGVLSNGAVDRAKAYAFLAGAQAAKLEAYAKSLKGEAVGLTGVFTNEPDPDMPGLLPGLRLDDGWTLIRLCSREDRDEDQPDLSNVPVGARVRVTARLEYPEKVRCNKDMRVEVLEQPVKTAEKTGEAKAERVTLVGGFCTERLADGNFAPMICPAPAEFYTIGGADKVDTICSGTGPGDLIMVTGTLRTPEQGMPYFDLKEPVTCERLHP